MVFIKYCFFSKNSQKFVTSPPPALGCYWLYKKCPANRSDWDTRIALRALKVSYSDVGEGGVAVTSDTICATRVIFRCSAVPREGDTFRDDGTMKRIYIAKTV